MKHQYTNWQCQMFWRAWWSLPWYKWYPADEDGPAEIYFGIGPLQIRAIAWRKYPL